jgi:hypothetical protein
MGDNPKKMIKRTLKFPFFLLSVFFLLVSNLYASQLSSQEIKVEFINPADSPIELLDAGAFLLSTKNRSSSTSAGKTEYLMRNQVMGWSGWVQYKNISSKRFIAVKFQWTFFDAFGKPLGSFELVDDESLNPRQRHEKEWEQSAVPAEAASARVFALAVKFEDDSAWTSNAKEYKDPIVDRALQDERERLLKLYQNDGIDALLKDLQGTKK